MKQIVLILAVLFSAYALKAQIKVSPFHHLPNPSQLSHTAYKSAAALTAGYTAWRFTAAAAGYDVINNKVLTGIGFGWNTMHIKTDSTGNSTWYTDFTVNAVIYASGNATPTYSYGNTNIIGLGPSIGILNKLINVGYVFYPPMNGGSSKSGVVFNVAIPLN